MNKDEIKKALEICADDCYSCDDCPYDDVINCGNTLKNDVRELIVEQEQEIERLNEKWEDEHDEKCYVLDELKEFHDKMQTTLGFAIKQAKIDILNKAKERLDSAPNGWAYTTYIDELIKEVQNEN